ncbi:MAG: helix-turn-helix domain-containing protein [bacterium]|nr:helix-turn-helix domain-containing protein [bacterium]
MGIDMIGLNLRRVREQNGFTQEAIAKKLGVSRQAVCMWESGKREVSVSKLIEVAEIFNMSIDEIIRPGKVRPNNNNYPVVKNKKEKADPKTCFELDAPYANEVLLVGDFNSWNAGGILLKKNEKGLWKIELALNPGKYEYKFIVDGKWQNDPANTDTAVNSYGTTNSVKEITK